MICIGEGPVHLAAWALGNVGGAAMGVKGFVEIAMGILSSCCNWKSKEAILTALGKMGDAVIQDKGLMDSLVRQLGSDCPDVRGYACRALGELGDEAVKGDGVLDTMVKVLGDANRMVKQLASDAVIGFGELVAQREGLVGCMAEMLRSTDLNVRWFVARTIGKIGESMGRDERVVESLMKLSEHGDDDDDPSLSEGEDQSDGWYHWQGTVRERAIKALGRIGGGASRKDTILSLLVTLVKDASIPFPFRFWAFTALESMGEATLIPRGDIVSSLSNYLMIGYPSQRLWAVEALRVIGETSAHREQVIGTLLELLKDDDHDALYNVFYALRHCEEEIRGSILQEKWVVELLQGLILQGMLQSEESWVHRHPLGLLGRMVDTRLLVFLLQDEVGDVRYEARGILRQIPDLVRFV